ncbi:hypothetical protein HAHI6034_04110 [Hathewaya histolytica]|uniref:Uncharacterized protein n=1 Tax=Hathewaya histolytica TaxID=1498 RepID=A0A4U9RRW8_HATHI|nr:hypothetical protein [Hathewaya histolytica]VTQ94371.1 Uncharacterised protein [Hathewaya histolytica]
MDKDNLVNNVPYYKNKDVGESLEDYIVRKDKEINKNKIKSEKLQNELYGFSIYPQTDLYTKDPNHFY